MLTNSSSKRFTLLRIDSTFTPCSVSWVNTWLIPWLFSNSISSEPSTICCLTTPCSGAMGALPSTSRTNVSTCNLPSRDFMVVFSISSPR
ncbi:Uncharacterised protein [Vibrio cholerae]|nr:Uncharacterised protein [Vibrio cholerae]